MVEYVVENLGAGNKYIAVLFIGIFCFMAGLFTSGLIVIYWGLKADKYVQKHHFELWKKYKTPTYSIKKRLEAIRLMDSLDDPIVDKLVAKGEKYWMFGLLPWLTFFLLVASLLFIFAARRN
jgi:hypothetical protein